MARLTSRNLAGQTFTQEESLPCETIILVTCLIRWTQKAKTLSANKQGETPLYLACKADRVEIFRDLLEQVQHTRYLRWCNFLRHALFLRHYSCETFLALFVHRRRLVSQAKPNQLQRGFLPLAGYSLKTVRAGVVNKSRKIQLLDLFTFNNGGNSSIRIKPQCVTGHGCQRLRKPTTAS